MQRTFWSFILASIPHRKLSCQWCASVYEFIIFPILFICWTTSLLAGEHGETLQGVRLGECQYMGCCCKSYNVVMDLVGGYMGQTRYVVSVNGELIELHPCHHTSRAKACVLQYRQGCGGGKITIERLRASFFRFPNPSSSAKARSSSVSIDMIL